MPGIIPLCQYPGCDRLASSMMKRGALPPFIHLCHRHVIAFKNASNEKCAEIHQNAQKVRRVSPVSEHSIYGLSDGVTRFKDPESP